MWASPPTVGQKAAPEGLEPVIRSMVEALEQAVAALYPAGEAPTGCLLANARQEDAARRALGAVERARAAFAGGLTPDAVLSDVEDAMNALGELTGRTAKEDIVSAIFSRFCVGK